MTNFFIKFAKALQNPGYTFKYTKNRLKQKIFLKKKNIDGQTYISYKGELYPEYLFKKKALKYIEEKALSYCIGKGIDIGSGVWPIQNAIPIEDTVEENAYKLDRFKDNSLDFVFSSHCVEHLDRWQDAISLWSRKLKPGGILFLYIPHESMKLWRPGEIFGMAHVWSPTWEILNPYIASLGMDILDFEKGRDMYWSFHIVAKKK